MSEDKSSLIEKLLTDQYRCLVSQSSSCKSNSRAAYDEDGKSQSPQARYLKYKSKVLDFILLIDLIFDLSKLNFVPFRLLISQNL